MAEDHRDLLTGLFQAGVRAADPAMLVRRAVRRDGSLLHCGGQTFDLASSHRLIVLAFGKAAPGMLRGFAEVAGGDRLEGVVATNGSAEDLPVPVFIGGHPLPTSGSVAAGRELLRLAGSARDGDLVVCLVSGGGSAIVEVPGQGIALEDLQATNDALLRCGVDIQQLNAVRKHLSRLKGGQLARAAADGAVVCLLLSDVVGNHVDIIASGPTAPDPTTYGDALAVVARCGLVGELPQAVVAHLEEGVAGQWSDTPAALDGVENRVIGSGATAAEGVLVGATRLGIAAELATTELSGEAREAAVAVISGAAALDGELGIWAGETTVTVTGDGAGGRNQEGALAAALHMGGKRDYVLLAAGTDGIDGTTEAAGALVDGSTLERAEEAGLDARHHLERNDSGTFFEKLGDQVITGPTGTNVGDIWLVRRS